MEGHAGRRFFVSNHNRPSLRARELRRYFSEVRCEENAQLIAAAPELAEAQEALLDVIPYPRNDRDSDFYARARAALAKAVRRG